MKSELALKIRVSTGKKPAKMMVTIDKVLKSIAAEVILIDQHVVLNWMIRPHLVSCWIHRCPRILNQPRS